MPGLWNRSFFKCLLTLTVFTVVLCFVVYSYNFVRETDGELRQMNDDGQLSPPVNQHQQVVKTILLWNPNADRVEIVTFGSGREAFTVCHLPPDQDCELVTNRTLRPIESYDAVVVNAPVIQWDEPGTETLPLLFSSRKGHQRIVFFSQESPVHTWGTRVDPNKFEGYFNWTMTYRFDSDIPLSYGRIRAFKPMEMPPSMQQIRNKTNLVAWMVSHCQTDSRREDYVNELKLHIGVDVYGDCGTLKCPRSWDFTSPNCYDMIESKYKFYLSFENAICRDYVTEKFFEALRRNIVPIVYGGANYRRIAPPHSFIDARQFKPQQLAEYLKLLDANDALYGEYFSWKEHYVVTDAGLPQMGRYGFCDLCRKLHQDKEPNTCSNIAAYWGTTETCQQHRINR